MKKFIKNFLPKQLTSLYRTIYYIVSCKRKKVDFFKNNFDSLTALKCTVSYNKYGGYCVPDSSRHRPAARKILCNDVYEPRTIEFITSNCGNGDIVHAGTYFGDFLPALSKCLSSERRVWAFEPNKENYRCAKITLEINEITNVILKNAALGAKQEDLLMKTIDPKGNALGGGSYITNPENSQDNKILEGLETVYVVKLDDIVEANRVISIIHLDVEGYEKQALTGALKTIQRCLPIIILENLPSSTLIDSGWFSEHILQLGYHMTDTIHGNSIFSCKHS